MPAARWWVTVRGDLGEFRICGGTPPGDYQPTVGATLVLEVCTP